MVCSLLRALSSTSSASRSALQSLGTWPSAGRLKMSRPLPPCRVQVVTSSVADGDGYWQFHVASVSCSGQAAAARAGASSRAESKGTRNRTP